MTNRPRSLRYLLAVLSIAGGMPAAALPADTRPPVLPALGADWIPETDGIDARTAPDTWPLADETAAGLDDMVQGSRDSARIGPLNDRIAGSAFAGRALRTFGGTVVVPVMTIHFRHRP